MSTRDWQLVVHENRSISQPGEAELPGDRSIQAPNRILLVLAASLFVCNIRVNSSKNRIISLQILDCAKFSRFVTCLPRLLLGSTIEPIAMIAHPTNRSQDSCLFTKAEHVKISTYREPSLSLWRSALLVVWAYIQEVVEQDSG